MIVVCACVTDIMMDCREGKRILPLVSYFENTNLLRFCLFRYVKCFLLKNVISFFRTIILTENIFQCLACTKNQRQQRRRLVAENEMRERERGAREGGQVLGSRRRSLK
jgi:hypothetical protein